MIQAHKLRTTLWGLAVVAATLVVLPCATLAQQPPTSGTPVPSTGAAAGPGPQNPSSSAKQGTAGDVIVPPIVRVKPKIVEPKAARLPVPKKGAAAQPKTAKAGAAPAKAVPHTKAVPHATAVKPSPKGPAPVKKSGPPPKAVAKKPKS